MSYITDTVISLCTMLLVVKAIQWVWLMTHPPADHPSLGTLGLDGPDGEYTEDGRVWLLAVRPAPEESCTLPLGHSGRCRPTWRYPRAH